MSEILLEVENLSCSYGHIRALDGVDLRIPRGSVVTLIGNNGAGKSTTLNAICGVAPSVTEKRGNVTFSGKRIERQPSDRIVRMGISQVPEGRRIFAGLTVEENLFMGALSRNDRDRVEQDLRMVYSTFPVLSARRRHPGSHLSGGEQQMLAIGRGLMARPKLMLLDEPSLGLAPLVVREIFRIIREIHSGGTTILLVEQNARMALETADFGYVLEKGRIALQAAAAELLSDSSVKRIYLGES